MKYIANIVVSPLRKQAADALKRARQLPIGPDRNDLRQLAVGLLWLERRGIAPHVQQDMLNTASANLQGDPTIEDLAAR
jgi:hypothetical protein